MGRKGSNKKQKNSTSGPHSYVTLRQESTGKKQTSINGKSLLKLDHIRNLAVWAGGESSILSLGAFFGQRLAALGEALGSSPDPSLFPCQRCETILQPGDNCSVRIEKNTTKARRQRKRSNVPTQNSVVYKCHFCSHRNLKRGTPRGYMKTVCPPKVKSNPQNPIPLTSTALKSINFEETGARDVSGTPTNEANGHNPPENVQATPSVSKLPTFLEAKQRKNNRSGAKKVAEAQSTPGIAGVDNSISTTSKKRKRKTWTSLKEIAERSGSQTDRPATNLAIPFFL